MAEGLNRVMLLGNLGQDPELRTTGGGASVLKLRLATSETFLDRNRERQERTEWHSVVIWGKRAEALSRFLNKGSRIFVEGSLRTSSYDDRDGNKRYRTEIIATNILLQGSGGGGGGGGGGRAPREDMGPGPIDDGPQPHSANFDDRSYGGAPPDDDDIPF